MNRKKIVLTVMAAAFIIALGIFIWKLDILGWQKLDLDKIYEASLASVVYDANGNSVGDLYSAENRKYTTLHQLPEYLPAAFVAAEDVRFYSHGGVDIQRIFGAIWHDIKTMSLAQGASTITQQLIKLTHLSSEKTFSRKVQEAYLAICLERELSKDEILEAYLNTVYFGSGAYGIGSAAQVYFGKEASQLSLGEASLLAGIIKSPSGYAPTKNLDAALERREYVITSMEDNGFIDHIQAQAARSETVSLIETSSDTVKYGWYMDEVTSEAQEALGLSADEIFSGGFSIYTALDINMQTAAEDIMENPDIYPEAAAQGALVAMDTHTGEIRAVVGGREYSVRRGLNRATMARRQTGSAIKPISTYAAAVDRYDYVPTTVVYDVQREYPGGYRPGNSGGAYNGPVTLRTALSRSLNAATVDLADTIGISAACNYARALGIPVNKSDENLSFALGSMTYGATPAQVCAAYCALANGGSSAHPHAIRRIEDRYGNVIYRYVQGGEHVLDSESSYIITDMLRTAAQRGTARALASLDFPIAAKTGTAGLTNGDTSDAWTVAYTPDIAVAVWMGLDSNEGGGMASGVTGGGYAAPVCARFFQEISDELSKKDFAVPRGLTPMLVDSYLLENELKVALVSENTPAEYTACEIFRNDALPTAVSDIWSAPQAVTDLTVSKSSSGAPLLRFTGTSDYAEYMVIRENSGTSAVIAVLECGAGEVIQYEDVPADTSQKNSYIVIPRHKLLYETGRLLTADYSTRVDYRPGGLLGDIAGLLDDRGQGERIESAEYPLF